MINFSKELPQNTTVVQSEKRSSMQKFQLQRHLEAVFDTRIWGMSEITSGAYCQQWIAICGATCICDAVFVLFLHNVFHFQTDLFSNQTGVPLTPPLWQTKLLTKKSQ